MLNFVTFNFNKTKQLVPGIKWSTDTPIKDRRTRAACYTYIS